MSFLTKKLIIYKPIESLTEQLSITKPIELSIMPDKDADTYNISTGQKYETPVIFLTQELEKLITSTFEETLDKVLRELLKTSTIIFKTTLKQSLRILYITEYFKIQKKYVDSEKTTGINGNILFKELPRIIDDKLNTALVKYNKKTLAELIQELDY